MTREELAVKLAKDDRFKALTPERRKAVFEAASARIGVGAPAASLPWYEQARERTEQSIASRESLIPYAAASTAGRFLPNPAGTAEALLSPATSFLRNRLQGALQVGAVQEGAESALANPALALQRGDPIAAIPDSIKGLLGQRPAEFGDVYRNAGFPAPIAASLGMALTPGGAEAQVAGAKALWNAPGNLARAVSRPNPQSIESLMSIPESEVHRLSPRDQGKWYGIQKQRKLQVLSQRDLLLKEQRKVLNRELGKTTQQRSLELRDQLPGLYHDQSVQYRQLFDAEFAEHAKKVVPDDELRAFVSERFKNDPEKLTDISARLGLSNKPTETALSGLVDEFGKPLAATDQPVPGRTFGQLKQQAKEFGQSLPISVRESLRTFTPEEDAIDETLETIAEYFRSKGVSFKASGRFWSEWKPIQRQATSELRPYNRVETRTQAASSRLKKLAKGIDPDNEVYAKKLADYLGIDDLPGEEVKGVIKKLDANQKEMLAVHLEQSAMNDMASPLAKAQYIAGKSHQASVEKWNRVLGILKGLGLLAGGGALVRAGDRMLPKPN